MLMSDALNSAIIGQIGHEFSAMPRYVAIAASCDGETLSRLAARVYRLAEEERVRLGRSGFQREAAVAHGGVGRRLGAARWRAVRGFRGRRACRGRVTLRGTKRSETEAQLCAIPASLWSG